jgi:linearmycin/streptolysin S transport system ATP-binding protein
MIKVCNLSKYYGDLKALNNINFTIKKGEIFGLLGPNGAGKSTTIKILSTLINSYTGHIKIDGLSLSENLAHCKEIIGVVPQEIALYEDFSAYDNLLFWGELNGVKGGELRQKTDKLLEMIGLSHRKNDLIKTYSGGMKRRINIAVALLHDPKILFMDEPTTGVDPQSRNKIFDIIEDLNKKGLTIIYTSHYMEEVERLCNTIAIIDAGKIVVQGTKAELQKLCDLKELVSLKLESFTQEQLSNLQKAVPFKMQLKDNTLTIDCNINKDLETILTQCSVNGIIWGNINILKSNLESIFLQLTGKQLRD